MEPFDGYYSYAIVNIALSVVELFDVENTVTLKYESEVTQGHAIRYTILCI